MHVLPQQIIVPTTRQATLRTADKMSPDANSGEMYTNEGGKKREKKTDVSQGPQLDRGRTLLQSRPAASQRGGSEDRPQPWVLIRYILYNKVHSSSREPRIYSQENEVEFYNVTDSMTRRFSNLDRV